ncbi:MAG: PolC-type DNA polymerase III [Oligoflexales bacterium]
MKNTHKSPSKSHNSRRHGAKKNKKPRFIPDPGICKTLTNDDGELLEQALSKGRYITFDIETTGGNPERNGITEICAIRYENDQPGEVWYSMVNPKVPIPPIVRKMTGITNQMVQSEPPIEDVMPGFIEFIGNDILVSHNTVGDLKFLTYFSQTAASHHLSNFFLCTHLLTEKLLPEAPDKSLNGLCKWLKLPLQAENHRAEADALATLELFRALLKKAAEQPHLKTIRDTIRLQGDFESALRLGWGLDHSTIQDVPPEIGCFQLLNSKKEITYFSAAQNMKSEVQNLRRHLDLPKQLARQVLASTSLKTNPQETIVDALQQESEIYKHSKTRYTPHQRHGRWVHTLAITIEPNEENMKVHVGYAPHHSLLVLGPVHDTKETYLWIQKFMQIFDIPTSSRKGLLIPKKHQDLFFSWLRHETPEALKKIKRERFSWQYLTSSKYRASLHIRIRTLSECSEITPPQKFSNLTQETGFLWVGRKKQKWIYPILNGSILPKISWSQSWENWIQSEPYLELIQKTTKDSHLPSTLFHPALTSWFTWSKRPEKEGIRYIRHPF